jgi:hypothetical protein
MTVCRSGVLMGGDLHDVPWSNWAGTYTTRISRLFEPASLPELVEIVAQATEQSRELHALGSGWAYETLATSPDWVLSLSRLTAELTNVVDAALTDDWKQRHNDPAGGERLFHVEAGVEIGRLNDVLADQGLAMITLGGANGQTLVGAMSTSTHGSDILLPPIHDLVGAIHLVTVAGQEIWLERESAPISTDDRLRAAISCPGLRIERNDELFNAVAVSAGRFGVIYSVVIRVRRGFRLAEWTMLKKSAEVLSALRSGVNNGTGLKTLLELLPAPPSALEADESAGPQFVELIFNSQDTTADCYIRRRWPTANPDDLNLDFSPQYPCNPGQPSTLLSWTAEAIRGASGVLAGIPVVGAFWAAEAVLNARALDLLAVEGPPLTGGRAMEASLNAVWNSRLGFIVPTLGWHVLGNQFAKSMKEGRRARADILRTGTRASNQSGCYRGESSEFIFSGSTPAYLDFLSIVLAPSPSFRQSGYISVRFSASSPALLSMHNWDGPSAVSIETASLKGLRDNLTWLAFLQSIALSCGGRPHWGQIHHLSEAQTSELYGPRLNRWREALMLISRSSTLFSNDFTRQRGLEPLGLLRHVQRTRKSGDGPGTETTHLCGDDDAGWGPVPVAEAISQIESGAAVYFTEVDGSIARIVIVDDPQGKYLRTEADTTKANNLDALPNC